MSTGTERFEEFGTASAYTGRSLYSAKRQWLNTGNKFNLQRTLQELTVNVCQRTLRITVILRVEEAVRFILWYSVPLVAILIAWVRRRNHEFLE
eukprot:scaffold106345_cov29-Prasinocladus_malaysianus.AAC.1